MTQDNGSKRCMRVKQELVLQSRVKSRCTSKHSLEFDVFENSYLMVLFCENISGLTLCDL